VLCPCDLSKPCMLPVMFSVRLDQIASMVAAGLILVILQVSLEHCRLPVYGPALCLCHCLVGLCFAGCPAL